ncbi:solute carrier family 23 member 1 isoform X2 [Lingula anatina]|uniref:Solute carrier family 23 member 1 isoform X2 n=1 Tax=Lingula anatina TaxID=7574 RepID=A0A2R2MNU0_LINAN|nr:solute carrier family 23 member 1 isoform X2 [Lingula anatina]|eukprot:XP_023931886.1 solute carrier family 23 member 1 isoform X2 [Lingula anatina]
MERERKKMSGCLREQHTSGEVTITESTENGSDKDDDRLQYSIEDVPPWYMCIFLGLQHYLTMFGATVVIPFILSPALCVAGDKIVTSQLIGTIFFVSGVATLLQTLFGCRLPIVQGGTFSFLVPTFAILNLPRWQCPTILTQVQAANYTQFNQTIPNIVVGSAEHTEVWQSRIREIQGAIMVASLFQLIIGFSGVMGILLRFIGPLAIAPTIALVGLSLFKPASDFSSTHWWIAILTIILIAVFSQYMRRIKIPCCGYSKKDGCHRVGYPIFTLFPVILSIVIVWGICAIITFTSDVTGWFPEDKDSWGFGARTDSRGSVLTDAPWFRFPYPGQWGLPTVSVSAVFGMLAGVLASMVESVGDYYACARLSGAPPPPVHAINRGIGVEGLGCIIAGIWGTGNGTTSYSENIGAIGITKVGSRRVIQFGAIFMLLLGVLGKFGALFVTIPDPVVGGVFMVMFGIITAVGISNLQFVDLNSPRNLFILGFSFFFGLSLPQWLTANPNAIQTGSETMDQILTVLFSTSMFVGGAVGFVLDNTIPGTDKERGILQWRKQVHGDTSDAQVTTGLECYDLPFGMSAIGKTSCLKYVPFCPTFSNKSWSCKCCPKACTCCHGDDGNRADDMVMVTSSGDQAVTNNGFYNTKI